jgi:exopolyphosphatase / guanosine-5'-triphosphate,3'-diphosphate pyrophosphatase
VARCGPAHPLVIQNHPVDAAGDPFPTLYWLTCPAAVRAVSRLEADGWIRRLEQRTKEDAGFGEDLDAAHRSYAAERARLAPEAGGWGGVGGSRTGLKCLHAHYAHHLAGGPDPVGAWVAERVEPVHAGQRRRVAAVDMGTNSIRLLVAEERGREVAELARYLVITRLGEGVDRTGRLDPRALRRTTDVLERYARRARALGAERIRVGATSAVRDAGDRRLFEAAFSRIIGQAPEVLSGEEEARVSFLGATTDLEAERPTLVFDIGGGSTELILGGEEVDAAASVDVGSVRITERVAPSDPPKGEDLAEMRRLAAEGLAEAELSRGRTLVGVAGTTTTVQAIALGLERYDPEAIHGSTLTRRAAERVAADLARMTVAERAGIPVMPPGREDVIVAGAQILLEILERWGFEECVVSERDILDGLAIEMVRAGR